MDSYTLLQNHLKRLEKNYIIHQGQLMVIKDEIKDEPEDFVEGGDENEPVPDEEALQGNFPPGLNPLPIDQISATWDDDNDIKFPIPEPSDSQLNIQIPATWNDSDINLHIPELTDSLQQIILQSNQSDSYPLNSGFRVVLQPNAHALEPSQVPATDQIRFCVANNLSQVGVPRIQTVQTGNLSSDAHFSEPQPNVLDNYEMLLQGNDSQAQNTNQIQISTITPNNSSPAQNFNQDIMCPAASMNLRTKTDPTRNLQSAVGASNSNRRKNSQEVQREGPARKVPKITADFTSNIQPAEASDSNQQENSQELQRRRPASKMSTTTADPATNLEPAAGGSKSKRRKNSRGGKRRRSAPKKRKTTCDPPTDLELAGKTSDSNQQENSQGVKRRRPACKKSKTKVDPATNLELAGEASASNEQENSLEEQFGGPGHIDPSHISNRTRNPQPKAGRSNSDQVINLTPVKIGSPIPLDPKLTLDLTRILQSEIGGSNLNPRQDFEPVLIRLNESTDTNPTLNPYRRRLRSATRASQQNFNALLICMGPPTEQNQTIDPTKNLQSATGANNSNETQNFNPILIRAAAPNNPKLAMEITKILQPVAGATNSNLLQNFNAFLISPDAPTDQDQTIESASNLEPAEGAGNSNRRQNSQGVQRRRPAPKKPTTTSDPATNLEPAAGANKSKRRKNSRGGKRRRSAPKKRKTTCDPPTDLELAGKTSDSNQRENSQELQRSVLSSTDRKAISEVTRNLEPAALASNSNGPQNLQEVQRSVLSSTDSNATSQVASNLELPEENTDSNQRENSQEVQRSVLSSTDRKATSEVARNLEPATLAGNSNGLQNSQEVQRSVLSSTDSNATSQVASNLELPEENTDSNQRENSQEVQHCDSSSTDHNATSEVARNLEPATLASNSNRPQSSEEVQRGGPAGTNPNAAVNANNIIETLDQLNDFGGQIASLEPMDIRTLRRVVRILQLAGSITNQTEPPNSHAPVIVRPAPEYSRDPSGLSSLERYVAENPEQPKNLDPAGRATDTTSTLNSTSSLQPAAEVGNSSTSQNLEESQRWDPAVGGNDSNQVQYFTPLKIVVPSSLVSHLVTQITRNIQPAIEAGNAQNSPEAPSGGLLPPQPQLILELSGIQEFQVRASSSYRPEPEPESSSLVQISGSVPPDPKLTFQFRGFLQPIEREDQAEPRKKLYQLRIHSLTPKFPIPPLMDDEVQFIGMRSRNPEPAWIEPIDDEVQFIGSTSKDPQPARIGEGVGSCDVKSENPEPAPIGDEVGSCGTESENPEPAPIGDEVGSGDKESENAEPAENCNELLIRPQVSSNLKRAHSFNDDQIRPPAAKIPKKADNFRDDHNYCSPAKNPELAQNSSENRTGSLAPAKPKLTFDFTALRPLMADINQAGCIECTGQFSGKSDCTKRVDEPDSSSTVKYETSDRQSATTSTGTSSKTCKCKDVLALCASFRPRVYWHCSVPHCPAIFEEESEKDKHEDFHKSFPENLFQCEDCKSRFHCFRFSQGQISMCKSLERLKCPQRNYDSPRSLQHKKHIARHISRMDCKECKREYPYIDKLTKHVIDSHHESIVFQCTKCPSCFVLSEFISRHICVRDIDDPDCELSPFIQIKEHWCV